MNINKNTPMPIAKPHKTTPQNRLVRYPCPRQYTNLSSEVRERLQPHARPPRSP